MEREYRFPKQQVFSFQLYKNTYGVNSNSLSISMSNSIHSKDGFKKKLETLN